MANKIALGQIEVGIAGGSDDVRCALGINESLRRTLLSANRAKGAGAKLKALMSVRPSMFFKPLLPRNGEPRALACPWVNTVKKWPSVGRSSAWPRTN